MSKGLKTVIGIAASIAIPFVAPAIASTIGLSTAIGATAGSALVGAGLGAISAGITGGNVGRGALLGGLGGGISGYMSAPAAAAAAPQVGTTGMSALDAGMAQYPSTGVFGGTVATGAPAGLSALDAGMAQYPSTGTFGGDVTPGVETVAGVPDVPQAAGLTLPEGTPLPTMAAGAPAGAAPVAAPKTFAEAIKRVPENIAARFKDPKALADLTLRAAGSLAGSALAGSGLSPEEEELLRAQTEELKTLRETNAGLFQQKLDAAQALLGESKYFDPNYFRQQAETAAKIRSGRQEAAGTRGLTGERLAYARRQYQLGAARTAPTAGAQAASEAQTGRLQTMEAGLRMIPSYPTTNYQQLLGAYDTAARRRRETQEDFGDLFGSVTGITESKSKGKGT
jgi:hypothetical protein